jgi:hypothetical protein
MNVLIAVLICLLHGSELQSTPGWELKRERNGIIIYTREATDSDLKEYRAYAVIGCPLEDVFEFALDLEHRPQWVNHCTGLEIIDTVAGRVRYHTSYDLPWPLPDRDLVVEMEVLEKDSNAVHLLTRSIDLAYPVPEGVVRMPRYREEVFYERLDAGHTNYRIEGFADPGGKVPAWVVNMFLVDGIYDSVIRIRETAAKDSRYKRPAVSNLHCRPMERVVDSQRMDQVSPLAVVSSCFSDVEVLPFNFSSNFFLQLARSCPQDLFLQGGPSLWNGWSPAKSIFDRTRIPRVCQ